MHLDDLSVTCARGVAWVLGTAMTLAALPNAGVLSLARLSVAKLHSAGLTRANPVSASTRDKTQQDTLLRSARATTCR